MQQVFVIHNQDGYFLGKSGEWLDGRDPVQLYRSEHRDEALNQSVETNSKNVELRLSIIECGVKSRLIPDIPADKLPPALENPLHEDDNTAELNSIKTGQESTISDNSSETSNDSATSSCG